MRQGRRSILAKDTPGKRHVHMQVMIQRTRELDATDNRGLEAGAAVRKHFAETEGKKHATSYAKTGKRAKIDRHRGASTWLPSEMPDHRFHAPDSYCGRT